MSDIHMFDDTASRNFRTLFGPLADEVRNLRSDHLEALDRHLSSGKAWRFARGPEREDGKIDFRYDWRGPYPLNYIPPPLEPFNHAPSREFLVTQAVLNALHQHYKSHIDHLGTAGAMRRLIQQCGWEHEQPSAWFVQSVRDQFSVLEAQYR